MSLTPGNICTHMYLKESKRTRSSQVMYEQQVSLDWFQNLYLTSHCCSDTLPRSADFPVPSCWHCLILSWGLKRWAEVTYWLFPCWNTVPKNAPQSWSSQGSRWGMFDISILNSQAEKNWATSITKKSEQKYARQNQWASPSPWARNSPQSGEVFHTLMLTHEPRSAALRQHTRIRVSLLTGSLVLPKNWQDTQSGCIPWSPNQPGFNR